MLIIKKPETAEKTIKEKDILDFFKSNEKPSSSLIGIEVEKFGIIGKTGENASYTGKKGFLAILGSMYKELGWEITKKQEGLILQMKRCGTTLDLESDGRIELAGAPHKSLHDLTREFRVHHNEITEISNIYGITWLGIGYNPISREKDIGLVQEERKKMIKDYHENFKKISGSKYGLLWSKKTSSVHVNVDYTSEQDFSKKNKILWKLSPVFRAIFANSPFSNGEFSGYMSYRSFVTASSLLPQHQTTKKLYESEFSYQDWIDYILQLPTMFFKKNDSWIHPNIPFKEYLEKGFGGYKATEEDFHNHTKTIWADVRSRSVIESRVFDSPPPFLVPSIPALVKGLLYNSEAIAACGKIARSWRYEDFINLQKDAAKYGLQATIQGEKLLNIAKELINIAETSLKKERVLDAQGRDESHYLKPIKDFVFVKGKSPAEWVVERWEGEWNNNFFPLFEWCKY